MTPSLHSVAAGLIEKYGFIPKSLYPESFSSSNSGKLNGLLTSYLRQSALGLRKLIAAGASKEEVRRQKEDNMEHVYKVSRSFTILQRCCEKAKRGLIFVSRRVVFLSFRSSQSLSAALQSPTTSSSSSSTTRMASLERSR